VVDSNASPISALADARRGALDFAGSNEQLLLVRLSGSWTKEAGLPSVADVQKQAEARPGLRRVAFDTTGLARWDTALLAFLLKVREFCAGRNTTLDPAGLPEGVVRLIHLAAAVPETKARREAKREPLLARIGLAAERAYAESTAMLTFVGEATIALVRFFGGKARYRRSDLTLTLQESGAQALPIVLLINFLVGLILAFVGAVQLALFGAEIFVADLVAIAMAREMTAIMTGIIMAGRTGAAFAAQLGTMTVNEEIDALKTLGFSPMEFLVLPRMLALSCMLPVLGLYGLLLGIAGGVVVAVGMLDISLTQYLLETQKALQLKHIAIGLIKCLVFGIVVALAGCMRGMQCGRSSAAVGNAATSAVVTAIVAIIVIDAVFAVVTNILGV